MHHSNGNLVSDNGSIPGNHLIGAWKFTLFPTPPVPVIFNWRTTYCSCADTARITKIFFINQTHTCHFKIAHDISSDWRHYCSSFSAGLATIHLSLTSSLEHCFVSQTIVSASPSCFCRSSLTPCCCFANHVVPPHIKDVLHGNLP